MYFQFYENTKIKLLYIERECIKSQLNNAKDTKDIKDLQKKYYSISNKISYYKNKDSIISKKYHSNREYIYKNYDKILEYSREYQRKKNGYYNI